MEIIVCIKPVPDPDKYSLLKIDPVSKRLVREGIPTIINPADRNALELALQLRGQDGRVTVLSMAPEFCSDKLRECLAMGADAAYLISDRALAGADTFATSYTLAQTIISLNLNPDLILLGNESADGATAQVAPQLGEWLDLPHLSNLLSLTVEGPIARAEKKTDEGGIVYEVKLPALFSIARNSNKPRLVSAMGVVKAKNKPLTVLSREDIPAEDAYIGAAGSPTSAGELIEPELGRSAAPISGEPQEMAAAILELIAKSGAGRGA